MESPSQSIPTPAQSPNTPSAPSLPASASKFSTLHQSSVLSVPTLTSTPSQTVLESSAPISTISSSSNTYFYFNNAINNALGAVKGVILVAQDVTSYWGRKLLNKLTCTHQDPKNYYRHLMSIATNYEQWEAAGLALDRLEGMV